MYDLQYGFKPVHGVYSEPEQWAWWDGAFSDRELDTLQLIAKNASSPGGVGGSDVVNIPEARRSDISWLEFNADYEWVYLKLELVVRKLNQQCFNFKLDGFGEKFQMSNYTDLNEGHYDWHVDMGKGPCRKLSVVLQLTDPSEYTGGDLQLRFAKPVQNIEKKRGLITIFPSWTLHRVMPVTGGSRQSLVSWVTGPDFN